MVFNEDKSIRLIFLFKDKFKDESIAFILKPEQAREDIILWNLYERISRLNNKIKYIKIN